MKCVNVVLCLMHRRLKRVLIFRLLPREFGLKISSREVSVIQVLSRWMILIEDFCNNKSVVYVMTAYVQYNDMEYFFNTLTGLIIHSEKKTPVSS